ncbi:unnamed protein product [Periconia digitata]|uniref:Uncharacterized protein n=1 Tax=Periconia digitata TaxID=1303443 RepID=A0A9W4UWW4_9PLEO|nr:unnamed protein product [Periconia digitata]
MSEVDDSFVKLGFWIDRSRGDVMGQTITTTGSTANTIIALLTVLITIAMSQLWSLFAFLYHQARTPPKGESRDGLFWQQQALLRTLPTPTSLFFDSLKVWWAWRRISKRAFIRSMMPIFMALLFAVGAVTSSIFSTYVISTSDLRVAINSPHCGLLNYSSVVERGGVNTPESSFMPLLKSYVKDCYQAHGHLPARCRDAFVEPNITFSISPADCPWEQNTTCLARKNESPAILMDSGHIQGSQFGFNTVAHSRINFRKKTVCSIMPMGERLKLKKLSPEYMTGLRREPLPNERFWQLVLYMQDDGSGSPLWQGFMRSELEANISSSYDTSGVMLWESELYSHRGKYATIPIKELNRTDADVSIDVIWLDSVQHLKPNDDPLFAAHQKRKRFDMTWNEVPVYNSDYVAGTVACANQYQFCHARGGGQDDFCSRLHGLPGETTNYLWPEANELQRQFLELILRSILRYDISWGPLRDQLLAGEQIVKGYTEGLPNDQWIKEVAVWESYVWAALQITLADYAVGTTLRDPAAVNYTNAPVTAAEKELCGSILMKKSGGFANVNVFGLTFIVTSTIIFSCLNIYILRFFIFLSKSRRALAPRLDQWVNDGVFQLQRRAFEAKNQGKWTKIDSEIPVTEKEEVLQLHV